MLLNSVNSYFLNPNYLPSADRPALLDYVVKEDYDRGMMGGAIYSRDENHRYALWRYWSTELQPLVVIGLNPSTATEKDLDPTIRLCVKRAQFDLEFGGLVMLNLFSYRTTYPEVLLDVAKIDPAEATGGPMHDRWLQWYTRPTYTSTVLCAWGNRGVLMDRAPVVKEILTRQGSKLYYIDMNKTGEPKHPLYCKLSLEMKKWQ